MYQPNYQLVANLGDANPLDHGGFFVYKDQEGRHDPLVEWFDPERLQVWRFELEPLVDHKGMLVPAEMYAQRKQLPKPVGAWEVWFSKHVPYAADHNGMKAAELRRLLCSKDILNRARGYQIMAEIDPQGFDPEGPLQLASKTEAALRYQEEIGKAGYMYCDRCDTWHSCIPGAVKLGQIGPCQSCLEEAQQDLQENPDLRINRIMKELGFAD